MGTQLQHLLCLVGIVDSALGNDGDRQSLHQFFHQLVVGAFGLNGVGSIAAHGGADHVDTALPSVDTLFIGGDIGHQDDIGILFPDLLQELVDGLAVAPLHVGAVQSDDIGIGFHQLVDLPHGGGNVGIKALVVALDQTDDRHAGLFLDGNHIPDTAGADHFASGLLCGLGEVGHQGHFFAVHGFMGQSLAGNDDAALDQIENFVQRFLHGNVLLS